MKKFLCALSVLFCSSAALAQNAGTVTNHAFPIGKGPGVQGYTSLLCGSAQLAVGQAAADPICRTVSGDWTLSAAGVATLATVNGNVGTFGSATACVTVTSNAKGLTTAISAATCTPAIGSITGLATGMATWLATPSSANLRATLTDETGTGLAYFQGGDIGTPSAGVGTNLTGTAAGLTAGNATKLATTRAIGIAGSTGLTATGVNFDGTAAINPALTGTLIVANGGTGDTGTAWTTFTPAFVCGTGTFTVTSARFKVLGKTTWVSVDATISVIGTGCTTTLTWTLPNTPQSGGGLAGREMAAVGTTIGCAFLGSATTVSCSLGNLSNWVVNERLVLSGVYENQ